MAKNFCANVYGGAVALLALCFTPTAQAQSWVQIQPQGTPPAGRFNNTAVYDSVSQRLIVFGGFDSSTCCEAANDVWVLTNASRRGGTRLWINLIPNNAPGSPPPLAAASAVYDSRTNRMILFGGAETGKSSSGDVWILQNANGLGGAPVWTKLQLSGPVPRQNHQAAYDPTNNRMIVFGGLSFTPNPFTVTPLNDLWALTNANGTDSQPSQWIQLSPTGFQPSARHGVLGAYDENANRLIIFGGCTDSSFSCSTDSTELWVLSNASGVGTPSWTNVAYSGAAPTAHSQFASVAYDILSNQLYAMGGRIGSAPPFGTFTNLTWVLSNANGLTGQPQWTVLSMNKPPSPRGQSVPPTLYDQVVGNFILFGGPAVNDSWVLWTHN
jgi:hypothetical protein